MIKWYGKQFARKLEAHLENNLDRVGFALEGDIKERFDTGHPIPNVIKGKLRASIGSEKPEKLKRRVGSKLKPEGGKRHSYAYYLELGFMRGGKKFMFPFLRPALDRNKQRIVDLMSRPM